MQDACNHRRPAIGVIHDGARKTDQRYEPKGRVNDLGTMATGVRMFADRDRYFGHVALQRPGGGRIVFRDPL